MSLFDYKVSDLHELLHKKELKVTDLVEESYKRIAQVDDKVQAFLTLDEDKARQTANLLDEKLTANSTNNLLFGMPIGIKDNIVTKGLRTTCASKILENFNPILDIAISQSTEGACLLKHLFLGHRFNGGTFL